MSDTIIREKLELLKTIFLDPNSDPAELYDRLEAFFQVCENNPSEIREKEELRMEADSVLSGFFSRGIKEACVCFNPTYNTDGFFYSGKEGNWEKQVDFLGTVVEACIDNVERFDSITGGKATFWGVENGNRVYSTLNPHIIKMKDKFLGPSDISIKLTSSVETLRNDSLKEKAFDTQASNYFYFHKYVPELLHVLEFAVDLYGDCVIDETVQCVDLLIDCYDKLSGVSGQFIILPQRGFNWTDRYDEDLKIFVSNVFSHPYLHGIQIDYDHYREKKREWSRNRKRIVARYNEYRQEFLEKEKKRIEEFWREHSIERKQFEETITQKKDLIEKINGEISKLRDDHDAIKKKIEELQDQAFSLGCERSRLTIFQGKKKKELEAAIDGIEKRIKEVQREVTGIVSKITDKTNDIEIINKEIGEIENKIKQGQLS